MNTGNSDIRMFLISKGFTHHDQTGWRFMNLVYDNYLAFGCDLVDRKLVAEFPDVEYNKKNTLSPKKKVIDMTWNESDNIELVIHNMENFFTRIIAIYRS